MERTLFATVGAIQRILPAAERVESTPSGNGDPASILQPLSRLKKLLEADDSEAAEFIVAKQNSFSAVLNRTEIEALTEWSVTSITRALYMPSPESLVDFP